MQGFFIMPVGLTEQFGVHLMLDGYGACPALLADKTRLHQLLDQLPREMGMHPISTPLVVQVGPMNRKDPGGLSGFVMIAESHLSFHTFPSRGFVTIDVYTCQNDLDIAGVTDRLTAAFAITQADVHVQKRGLRYPAHDLETAAVAGY
jgi:S-adenosylmethionine decarboxylase